MAAKAFSDILGKQTVFIRSGGSIPIVGDFATHLGIPTVLMGFGLPDDGLHSPNEKYQLDNYYKGIMTIAHFFEQYGAAAPRRRDPVASRHNTVRVGGADHRFLWSAVSRAPLGRRHKTIVCPTGYNLLMKRLALFALFSSLAFAESWNGTLVDVMCKNQDLASHTTKCALSCAKSGYGLVLADGKFVKFDEAGNAKALAALKATNKEKDLKAKVTGTLDGETVQVESVELE